MTIVTPFDNLERLLKSVEEQASGFYEIIAIVPLGGIRSQVGVVIRFEIVEVDPPFDEEEIRRKLGFGD